MPTGPSPANGGCDFAIDPFANSLDFGFGPLWRPEVMPYTAFLTKWSPDLSGPQIALTSIGAVTQRYETGETAHLVVGQGDRIVRLCCERGIDIWGGVMMPPGLQNSKRIETSRWLLDRITRGIDIPSPEGSFFSPALAHHLATLLRLLDGIEAGANQRELATLLIDPDLATFKGAFPGSGPAKKIQRWRSDALWLVNGGYRRLLSGEWPPIPRR